MDKVKKEISIVIPSRGRPEKLLEMMNSVIDCASSPELIEFVLYLDNDETSDYEMFYKRAVIIKGDRAHMGKMFSACILKSSGKTIVICNDDVIVSTNKWDDIIYENLKSYDDNIFLMYPNDLNKGSALCTFPIFSKELFLKFPGILPGDLTLIDLHLRDLFFQLKGLGINRIKYLNNDLFILYADLRFKLSSQIFIEINNKIISKKILSSKVMESKMTSVRFFKECLLMFWFSSAPLLYRFKLLLYMVARRTYSIFIYRFKSS